MRNVNSWKVGLLHCLISVLLESDDIAKTISKIVNKFKCLHFDSSKGLSASEGDDIPTTSSQICNKHIFMHPCHLIYQQ